VKICSKCGVEKNESDYTRDKSRSDGYSLWCKQCQSAYCKSYYQKNKEKVNAHHKKYNEKHKEEINAYHKNYKKVNKKAVYASTKKYNEKHKEERNAYHKNYRETRKKQNDDAAFKEYIHALSEIDPIINPDLQQELLSSICVTYFRRTIKEKRALIQIRFCTKTHEETVLGIKTMARFAERHSDYIQEDKIECLIERATRRWISHQAILKNRMEQKSKQKVKKIYFPKRIQKPDQDTINKFNELKAWLKEE